MRIVALRALLALCVLVTTACGGSRHDQADVDFAQAMVPHHVQAVDMSDVLLAKPEVAADVRALATTIKAEQQPEIVQMQGWLEDWGAAAPAPGGGMNGMPGGGMMSQQDMDALDAATGARARTLYLQGMVRHHQGAVDMAQTEVDRGRNPDAVALARSIVTSQQAEIETMRRMLAG